MKRFANPVPQYFSDAGEVASAGKIYFLQEGTDILTDTKAIYLDAEGLVQSINPVTLPSSGRMPNVFGEGKYRVKAYDSSGASLWTRDYDFDSSSSQFGPWNSQESYSINDIARGESGDYYKSEINNNRGNDPDSPASSDKWSKIALLEFFNADKPGGYPDNAIVILNGRLYASNIANNTNTPPHSSWDDLSFNNAVVGDFSATGDATFATLELQNSNDSDPLKLDWYEEGTFTPTVYGSGTAGTTTYVGQSGKFTRIGNVIYFLLRVEWSNQTGSGSLNVGGLPSYQIASFPNPPHCAAVYYSNLNVGAGKELVARMTYSGGVNLMYFVGCDPSGGASSAISVDTSGEIVVSGFYFLQ